VCVCVCVYFVQKYARARACMCKKYILSLITYTYKLAFECCIYLRRNAFCLII